MSMFEHELQAEKFHKVREDRSDGFEEPPAAAPGRGHRPRAPPPASGTAPFRCPLRHDRAGDRGGTLWTGRDDRLSDVLLRPGRRDRGGPPARPPAADPPGLG